MVGCFKAGRQIHLGLPAQGIDPGAIHKLARRAVGLAGVENDVAPIADDPGNGFGQLPDGDVVPATHVDVAEHRLGVLPVGGLRQVHDVQAGGSHVVHVQKFAPGRAGSPDGDAGRVAGLGLMEAANERWDYVRVFRVVVVARAVEVGGHDATVVHPVAGAVLAVVALAQLDAGDLGDGVGLVGGFQPAGEQGVFAHGLRGQLGVDAARTEEQQLLYAVAEGRVDDVGLHHQVLVDEFGRVGIVGVDAAHLGSGQVDLVGLFCNKKGANGGLVSQVQFGMGTGNDALGRVVLGQQLSHDGRTHHATVAGDVDFEMHAHALVLP